MKKLIIVVLVTLGLFLAYCTFAFFIPQTPVTPPPSQDSNIPPETLLDSDEDGFSDWFEENIAGYDPAVPNDRYFVYCDYQPEAEDTLNTQFNLIWQILVEKNKVPSQNVLRLTNGEATRSNLQKAIEEIAVKADGNDIVFVSLAGHGWPEGIYCCCDGAIFYSELDTWLDEIKAKVVIIRVFACQSVWASEILKDGSCPRIVITGTFSMYGLHSKETAKKYPWLPTNCDGEPALGYHDVLFGFANQVGNRDGYVSVGEFIDALREDVEMRWHNEEWMNLLNEYPSDCPWWDGARDEYGISHNIYLIEHPIKENVFWKAHTF